MAANNTVTVQFSGKVFENGVLLPAIQSTIDKTTIYGANLIASRTPVRTGMLRDSWMPSQNNILNNVSYGIFIEDGTRFIKPRRMVFNSLDQIEEYWFELFNKAMD